MNVFHFIKGFLLLLYAPPLDIRILGILLSSVLPFRFCDWRVESVADRLLPREFSSFHRIWSGHISLLVSAALVYHIQRECMRPKNASNWMKERGIRKNPIEYFHYYKILVQLVIAVWRLDS